MNFINGTLVKKGEDVYFEFEGVSLKLPADKAAAPEIADYIGKEVIVGLRPEAISDEARVVDATPDSSFDVDVDVTELMGAEIYLYLKVGDPEEPTSLIARVSSRSQSRAGDKIKVAFDMTRLHIFDKDTERCVLH
jgi:multiple sugar transport system ATP-binding protein